MMSLSQRDGANSSFPFRLALARWRSGYDLALERGEHALTEAEQHRNRDQEEPRARRTPARRRLAARIARGRGDIARLTGRTRVGRGRAEASAEQLLRLLPR